MIRQAGHYLLLLGMISRALVPVGFMPALAGGDGHLVKLVICTSSGAKTVTLDDSGQPIPDDKRAGQHDHPCVFAGLTALSLPTLDIVAFAPVDGAGAIVKPKLAVQLPPTRAGPQHGARGPPAFS